MDGHEYLVELNLFFIYILFLLNTVMILFIYQACLNAYFSILEILFLKEEPDIIIKYHELFIYICIFYVQINGFYVEINDIQFKI